MVKCSEPVTRLNMQGHVVTCVRYLGIVPNYNVYKLYLVFTKMKDQQ